MKDRSLPPEDDEQLTQPAPPSGLPAPVGNQPPASLDISEQETIPVMPGISGVESAEAGQKPPLIVVRDLRKTYLLGQTKVRALRGVSLEIQEGEFVAIMGPSGSGKSTFMNLLGCLDTPTRGEYWLAGRLVSSLSKDELAAVRNRLVGFVFQGFNLLSRATALNNVALPMLYAGVSREQREERARQMLALVGLGKRLHHKPSQLSGGQQQRVAIARALINNPSLLLADEPTGNLDSRTSVEIMAILQALNRQRGLTIVLVTHEPDIAAYARRQVLFRDGLVVRDEPVINPRVAVDEWKALSQPDTTTAS
ncbi:MAG TPA: ABC transporter ATP-binding protein [Ktedonobacteraceae bacterium]|nr:ABC transporter ATP-binding protein [Ktedonobacteraceae bacterium]